MRHSKVLGFFLCIFITTSALSQTIYIAPLWGKLKVFSGYAKTLTGEVFPYHSIYTDIINQPLLTRCIDGKSSISWLSDTVYLSGEEPYVYLTWIFAHSSGTNSGTRYFNLAINDNETITIITKQKNYPDYEVFTSGTDSTALLLDNKMKDKHGDLHGYAILRIPSGRIKTGYPIKISITGQKQNSPDWMMAFQFPFKNLLKIQSQPFLLKNNQQQVLNFKTFLTDGNKTISINAGGQHFEKSFSEEYNNFNIAIPTVAKEKQMQVTASVGNQIIADTIITINPVTHRNIYLIPHSHNDIGYSHHQTVVEQIQNDNIRAALRAIKRTENSSAPFKWNIESAWAVENFFTTASLKEKQDFVDAIKKKKIGLSGFYANELSGLMSQDELYWNLDFAHSISKKLNLPMKSVMQSDIPGMSWGMVSALAKYGIRYLSHAPNYMEQFPDMGDRIGSTLREQGDKIFWWKSVNGKDSILLWTCGKGYSAWHSFTIGEIAIRGEEKIGAYMKELQAKNYPYDIVQWRYNIVSDNGPADTTLPIFVQNWNNTYSSPTMRIATTDEVFEDFEKKYGNTLTSVSGDFTTYWDDGAYSSADEEAKARILSRKISAIEKFANKAGLKPDAVNLYRAKRAIIMWHEHTWGSWNSISDPESEFTKSQWDYKKAFVDSATYYVHALEQQLKIKYPAPYTFQSKLADATRKRFFGAANPNDLFRLLFINGTNPNNTITKTDSQWAKFANNSSVKYQYNKTLNILHCTIEINKNKNSDKEALHIELPFTIPNARYRLSVDKGFYEPCNTQLAGSNRDYYYAQQWVDISNNNFGATVFCPQASLYEFGQIENEDRINSGTKLWSNDCPKNSTLYVYALNNYWHTNFRAYQSGLLRYDIYIQFHDAFNNAKANKFVEDIIAHQLLR